MQLYMHGLIMISDYNFFVRRYGLYILKPTQRSLIIGEIYGSNCRRCSAIVFPAVVEMVQINGRETILPDRIRRNIFYKREEILERCLFQSLPHGWLAGWLAKMFG